MLATGYEHERLRLIGDFEKPPGQAFGMTASSSPCTMRIGIMHVADREVRAKPIEHQPIHRKDRIMRRGDFHRRRIGRIEHESGSFTRPLRPRPRYCALQKNYPAKERSGDAASNSNPTATACELRPRRERWFHGSPASILIRKQCPSPISKNSILSCRAWRAGERCGAACGVDPKESGGTYAPRDGFHGTAARNRSQVREPKNACRYK